MDKVQSHEEVLEKNGKGGNVELDAMEVLLDVSSRQSITEEIVLKRRGKGNFKVKIRAIGGDEYKDIQDQCTTRIRDRKAGGMRSEFDGRKSQKLVVLACVIEPNLTDHSLLAAYKVNATVPEDIIDLAFLPGEVDFLAESILELSGYTDEVLEKVKA